MFSNKSIKQDKRKELLVMPLGLIHSAIVKPDEMEAIAVVKILYIARKKKYFKWEFLLIEYLEILKAQFNK